MAFKIKLSHTRRPRGFHALTDRADRAERRREEMRSALAEAEREGVGLRAEKNRAAAHLVGCIAEHERAEAEEELAVFDLRTSTDKLLEMHADTVASMDRTGELLADVHSQLDSIERDLDEFIKKGGE